MSDRQAKSTLAKRLSTLLRLSKTAGGESRRPPGESPSQAEGGQRGGAAPSPAPPSRERPGGSRRTTQPAGRIVWESGPQRGEGLPSPPLPVKSTPTPLHTIDWGGITSFGLPDPQGLVGVEDAFDHTPLLPGERVAFCTRDKVAYHLETWEFLQAQNRGRCCICGQTSVIQLITLPGTPVLRPEVAIPQPLGTLLPDEKIISLKEVPDYLNLAVTVEDYVYEVYQTKSTGSYFVRFEPRSPYQPVFSGFKVVIFKNYVQRWTAAGLAVEDYRFRRIRVRGVVQQHPKWGIEILVNSPRVIEIVPGNDQKSL